MSGANSMCFPVMALNWSLCPGTAQACLCSFRSWSSHSKWSFWVRYDHQRYIEFNTMVQGPSNFSVSNPREQEEQKFLASLLPRS
ncbi:hypothetical protein C8J56DRAFT_587746 [Mycena floridula]|nr:hypothetical protein C8J56DRAFT_587746 [Mycena floridula]